MCLFCERAMCTKQSPNAKGAQKSKKEAGKSSLSVLGDLLGALTGRSMVLGSLKTGRSPCCSSQTQGIRKGSYVFQQNS